MVTNRYEDDPRVAAYVFGELDTDEHDAFEVEMAQSAELRALVEATRETVAQLQAEFADEARGGSADSTITDSDASRRRWEYVERVLGGAEQRIRDEEIEEETMSHKTQPTQDRDTRIAGGTTPDGWWRRKRWWSAAAAVALVVVTVALSTWSYRTVMLAQQAARMEEMPDSTPVATPYQLTLLDSSAQLDNLVQDSAAPAAAEEQLASLGYRYRAVLGKAIHEAYPGDQWWEPVNADLGQGAGQGGDQYDLIVENPFQAVPDHPLSTFSIDVDTASYSKVRMYLQQHGSLPPRDAVRLEELINYFPYDYSGPAGDDPFAAHLAVAKCPWDPTHQLVRVALKGKTLEPAARPASNLVFLVDVSGSMNQPNKLPLLKVGLAKLVEQLTENDRVAMVVYAGAAGLVLDSTTGDRKVDILQALDRLSAGGSTNGGAGVQLAYQVALENFVAGGTNRVLLCTDGDFNVGTTSTDQLVQMVEKQAKSGVALTVLGFGMGNHQDSMLEQISNKGDGNYAFVDSEREAHKVLVEQISGTLVTIAKDVKIQVEFNPREVQAYRLLGYENRMLAAEDFRDDTKDAGEIGAGHTVTAIYEIVPATAEAPEISPVDPLKYQTSPAESDAAASGELLTLKLRYKMPQADSSQGLEFPLTRPAELNHGDQDFQFATAAAAFGMLLRNSEHKGSANYEMVLELAKAAQGYDSSGYRAEMIELVQLAQQLAAQQDG